MSCYLVRSICRSCPWTIIWNHHLNIFKSHPDISGPFKGVFSCRLAFLQAGLAHQQQLQALKDETLAEKAFLLATRSNGLENHGIGNSSAVFTTGWQMMFQHVPTKSASGICCGQIWRRGEEHGTVSLKW